MTAATIAPTAPSRAATTTSGREVRRARVPFIGLVLPYALLAVAVTAFAFLAVGPRLFGYRTVTMLTGSMRPLIPPGAVAVDVPEPVSALRPGQVISFQAPEPGHPVITHRVVAVKHVGSRVLIQTKGDANSAPDPWLADVHGDTVWRVRGVVPYLGFGIHALRSGTTRMVATWLLPAAALAWFLVGVWRPAEGGEPACPEPLAPEAVPSAARSFPSRSSSPRRSTSRSRSRKRRQRPRRNCQRRQRRSTRSSR